ncbi:hypothetical protein [Thauera sp.]|uniref:hypothetical protein n=1 Tax=Thauera sp. TaxID=1905334 RepID=UPI0039E57DAD
MSTVQQAMRTMFNQSKQHLSMDELKTLESLAEEAADEARRLSGICEGLGCLISADGDRTSRRAGNFRSADDVPELLFSLAHSFDTIAAMVEVGEEAAFLLNERKAGGQA